MEIYLRSVRARLLFGEVRAYEKSERIKEAYGEVRAYEKLREWLEDSGAVLSIYISLKTERERMGDKMAQRQMLGQLRCSD